MPDTITSEIIKQDDAQAILNRIKANKTNTLSRSALYLAMQPLTKKAIKALDKLLTSKDPRIRLRAIEITMNKTLPDLRATENKTEVTERKGVVMLPQERIIDNDKILAESRNQVQTTDPNKRSIKIDGQIIEVNTLTVKTTIDSITPSTE